MGSHKPQVWIVEDSPVEGRRAIEALSTEFDCELFTSGSAPLERLAAGATPSLLILDWELPDISGPEVCRFIRTSRDELVLPIILVTVHASGPDVVAGLAAGANDYLRKPYVVEELRARARVMTRLQRRNREVDAQLLTTLWSIGDAVISTDLAGRIRLLNPAAAALTGWFPSEAVGRSVSEVVVLRDERTRLLSPDPVERVLAHGVAHRLIEPALLVRRDGTELPVEDSATPIRDLAGELTGAVVVLRDVTAKRRADAERELARDHALRDQAELRRLVTQREQAELDREELVSALAAQPLLRVCVLRGPDLVFEQVNPSYQDQVGRGRVLLGRPLLEALPELAGQGFDAVIREVMRSGKAFVNPTSTSRLDRGDGVLVANHFSVVYQPLRGRTGEYDGVLVLASDVTAAVAAQELERQLIGIASHDLRTPLSTISLATDSLLATPDSDTRTQRSLHRIKSAAERGARMVSDLLDFTQARVGGGIAVVRTPGNLHAVVRQAVEDAHGEVAVTTSGDGDGAWDADRMSQVVANLLANALKYGSNASVRSEDDGEHVTVSVHNLGEVIPASAMERIFEPLQRATTQLENKARSVGLGLYIVKHLVEAHGGRIAVRSSPEDGTTFTFVVPKRA